MSKNIGRTQDSQADIDFCVFHCPFPNRRCNGKLEDCKRGIAPGRVQPEKQSKLQLEANSNRKLQLYKQGLSDGEIAKACRLTTSTIQQWRSKNKLPPNYNVGFNVNRIGSPKEATS